MNRHAAFAGMTAGVGSFVLLSELTRNGILTLPGVLDPLMVSLVAGVGSLALVARLTQPSPEEAAYFDYIAASRPSQKTIAEALESAEPLSALRREYRHIVATVIGLTVLSFVVWGFFAVNLAF